MSEGWCLTESDPAIFTILLSELGVSGLQVEELWSLDNQSLEQLKPVHALIFLFKYVNSDQRDPSKQAGEQQPAPPGTWFAHQVITNACATLAILNAVMNIPSTSSKIQLGQELSQLKEFSVDLDSQMTGELLTNSERIRAVHNSFARPDPFQRDEPKQMSTEDAYHFITYLPLQGKLYELDGLNGLPVFHGKIPEGQSWTSLAREVIQNRINTYSSTEVHFNLMAVCEDRLNVLEERKASMTVDSMGYENLKMEIEAEEAKRKRWAEEVAIKRHNHIGLIHALMVGLAKHGSLAERVNLAKQKMVDRQRNRTGGHEMQLD
ncbi:uncharacterized protein PGTG_10272 [Puccinia graminis f. sp. tritici CRL 75-36-700-3]|uniref:Ubiquitin carboxyl-terminal hydrolase n=1 Tax=Puccinia graminis f. sp. tritici (strain CRL 75-36-700-3 / race SCCL) TaxID=418459 RepID=E3KKH6_PUCGT|nr:uncharacterized protein PGTG_10272 [Puccinia graminis f. sp. tritici CRL 75-36-700-3]EFP84801.1 hypothetical protein PGTG_10272 [Puccinia graminis f. sp. tritici CRL 75-36-700-3]